MSTTQTVPAPTNDSGGFGAADDLSFLDDPANLVTESDSAQPPPSETAQPPETPAAGTENETANEGEELSTQTAADGAFKGIKPAVVAIMKHLAKQEALNLEDPRDFKYGRMIAEKENRIRELQLAAEPGQEAKTYLDRLRDPEPETPAAAKPNGQPAAAAAAPAAPALPAYRELAEKWTGEGDFYQDYMDSLEMPEGADKAKRVSDVMFGLIDVAVRAQHMPALLRVMNQLIDDRVGPAVKQAEAARDEQTVREVVDVMAADKQFEGFNDLFDKASDELLDYNGGKIADTWVNRAVIAFPQILEIKVKGRNDAESKRLTTGEQYAAAFRVMKLMRTQSSDTSALTRGVATGIAIEKSKRDPVRQALNAGKTRGAPTGDRMFDEIINSGDGTTSFASVFK